MQIKDILAKGFSLSFEVFPPQRDGNMENLFAAISELQVLQPDFISVTYSASGGTKDTTVLIASRIKNEFPCEAIAHLTCVGATSTKIATILAELSASGVENILALRGDPPKGETMFPPAEGGFSFASNLTHFIKEKGGFCVGVAGYLEKHPEAPSLEIDIKNLRKKVDAGADFITTQMFFDNALFLRFVDMARKENIAVPVLPGVFPVLNYNYLLKIDSLCRARIPLELGEKIDRLRDKPDEAAKYGIEFAIKQAYTLIAEGVVGLHFYTMNKSAAALEIVRSLPLSKRHPVTENQ